MNFKVNGIEEDYGLWGLPAMNYGQFQRWTGHEVLSYEIELERNFFLQAIADRFEQFRLEVMEDDNQEGFPELAEYRSLGWPLLKDLAKSHPELLEKLILFNDQEMLNELCRTKEGWNGFSINSLDRVDIDSERIRLFGRCFKM